MLPYHTAFPLTVQGANGAMTRSGGHMDLVNDFDTQYHLCMVRLRVVESYSGSLIASTQQRFGSFAAIRAWCDANVPNAAGYFSNYVFMDVFDEIDPVVPVPPRLYGKNRLWAGLTNKSPQHHYWRPRTTSCKYAALPHTVSSVAAMERAKVLHAIWINLYPAIPIPDPTVTPWTEAEFSMFWIAGNRWSRYDMPMFLSQALAINIVALGDRSYWDGSAVVQAESPSYWAYDQSTAEKCVYGSIAPTSPMFSQVFGTLPAFKLLGTAILAGESVIVGYPMTNGTGGHAVIVRPVGVDQWYVDNYDTTQYQLEAVGSTRHDERPKIRKLILTQVPDHRTAGPFSAPDIGYCFGASSTEILASPGKHSLSTGSVRLQYRDVNTGRVSPLSIPRIVPVARKRARPFSLLVVNEQAV